MLKLCRNISARVVSILYACDEAAVLEICAVWRADVFWRFGGRSDGD